MVTCPEHSRIRNELDLVPQMPLMPDQRVSLDCPTPRSRSSQPEQPTGESGGPGHKTRSPFRPALDSPDTISSSAEYYCLVSQQT